MFIATFIGIVGVCLGGLGFLYGLMEVFATNSGGEVAAGIIYICGSLLLSVVGLLWIIVGEVGGLREDTKKWRMEEKREAILRQQHADKGAAGAR